MGNKKEHATPMQSASESVAYISVEGEIRRGGRGEMYQTGCCHGITTSVGLRESFSKGKKQNSTFPSDLVKNFETGLVRCLGDLRYETENPEHRVLCLKCKTIWLHP